MAPRRGHPADGSRARQPPRQGGHTLATTAFHLGRGVVVIPQQMGSGEAAARSITELFIVWLV